MIYQAYRKITLKNDELNVSTVLNKKKWYFVVLIFLDLKYIETKINEGKIVSDGRGEF